MGARVDRTTDHSDHVLTEQLSRVVATVSARNFCYNAPEICVQVSTVFDAISVGVLPYLSPELVGIIEIVKKLGCHHNAASNNHKSHQELGRRIRELEFT